MAVRQAKTQRFSFFHIFRNHTGMHVPLAHSATLLLIFPVTKEKLRFLASLREFLFLPYPVKIKIIAPNLKSPY